MKFVDYKNKELTWYNRNYFWIVSIIHAIVLILIYYYLGTSNIINDYLRESWKYCDGLRQTIIGLENVYTHASWEHVLHNCLGFLLGSIYVERKLGSVNFFLLLLGLTAFMSYKSGTGGCGNSGIWFALFAYMLVDYIFSFRRSKRSTSNIILGTVLLILEYIRSGFFDMENGGIGWGLQPVQLYGHFGSFYFGLVTALIIQVVVLYTEKQAYLKYNKN